MKGNGAVLGFLCVIILALGIIIGYLDIIVDLSRNTGN